MSVYAVSDLHGRYDLWEKIKEHLAEDDILYCLGDVADRGPDGWKLLKELLADKRVIFIKGNHEDMLADRLGRPNDYHVASLHHQNGGEPTWNDAENDPDAQNVKWTIRQLPLYAVYENIHGDRIFMSHSGATEPEDDEDMLWDRTEYIHTVNNTDYNYIIHGHTPIGYLIEDLEEVYRFYWAKSERPKLEPWDGGAYFYHGYRFDIDCGSAFTDRTVMLNLDTFESIKIKGE